jgi:hypothetical protein
LEECWPCPVFANYTLAFALQLRKKHGKTSVRVAEEIQRMSQRDSKNEPKRFKEVLCVSQTVTDTKLSYLLLRAVKYEGIM